MPVTHASDNIPDGFEAVRLDTGAARQVLAVAMSESGAVSLPKLQRAYQDKCASRTPSDATPSALPAGPAAKYAVLYALSLHLLHTLWHRGAGETALNEYKQVVNMTLRDAPHLLFQSACDRADVGRGDETRLWYCPGEVLLLVGATLDHVFAAQSVLGPLRESLDRVRPRWRAEHTANWRAPQPRAAVMPFDSVPAGAWATAQHALIGEAEALSVPNAANLVRYAITGIEEPWAERWTDVITKVRAAGITPATVAPGPMRNYGKSGPLALEEVMHMARELRVAGSAERAEYWAHQLLAARLPEPKPTTPTAIPGPTL